MNPVFLLLGGNLGNRFAHMFSAISMIDGQIGRIRSSSSFYLTEPWGVKNQPWFLNFVLEIETAMTAHALLDSLKGIEDRLGRIPAEKWGPRILDVDILLYNNQVVDVPGLAIPHKHLHERRFVLEPLNEVAPELIHPLLDQKVSDLLSLCSDQSLVYKL